MLSRTPRARPAFVLLALAAGCGGNSATDSGTDALAVDSALDAPAVDSGTDVPAADSALDATAPDARDAAPNADVVSETDGNTVVAPVLEEDFSTYTDLANMLADPRGIYDAAETMSTQEMLLDTSVRDPEVGSPQTLRYHYLHPGDGVNSITIERRLVIPGGAVQEVWAEFRFKYSTNFTTDNALAYPNDHKFIFGDTRDDLSYRWALYIGSDIGPYHNIEVERPLSSDHGAGPYYPNQPGVPFAETLWTSDTWHTARFDLRHSTTGTGSDGAMRVWIDGQLIHDESGFNTHSSDGSEDRITGFSFCHNQDDGPGGVDMYLWWSRIRYWTRNPGW